MRIKIIQLFILNMICCCVFAQDIQTELKQKLEKLANQRLEELKSEHNWPSVKHSLEVRMKRKLVHCSKEYDIKLQAYPNSIMPWRYLISCTSPKWHTFAYVYAKEVMVPLLVAKHHLSKGDIIRDEDIEVSIKDISKDKNHLNSYIASKEEVVGQLAKTSIEADEVLLTSKLTQRVLVKAGQLVDIIAIDNGIQIVASGVSLQRGYLNSKVRVKNKESGKIINAIVIGEGKVLVK